MLIIISLITEVHSARDIPIVARSATSHSSTVTATSPAGSIATSSSTVLRTVASSVVLDIDIRRLIVFLVHLMHRGMPVVDGVFPDIIKGRISPTHVIVHYWRFLYRLEGFTRLHLVGLVLGGAGEALHVHDVLGVGVFLLAQLEHFEFLAHGRVVLLVRDDAERAQRLLCHAVLLGMSEALVLFNLSDSASTKCSFHGSIQGPSKFSLEKMSNGSSTTKMK